MFRLAAAIAGGSAFVMMLLTSADVVGRYFLRKPVPGALEVSTYLMVILVFLGAAYAQAQGRNVRVELLTARLSQKNQVRLNILIWVLLLGLGIVLTWETGLVAYHSWQIGEFESEAMPFVKVWPVKVILAMGCLFLTVEFLFELLRHIHMLRHRQEREV